MSRTEIFETMQVLQMFSMKGNVTLLNEWISEYDRSEIGDLGIIWKHALIPDNYDKTSL